MKSKILLVFGLCLFWMNPVFTQIDPPSFDRIIKNTLQWLHFDPEEVFRQQISQKYSPDRALSSLLSDVSKNDFDQCFSDVSEILVNATEGKFWALKILDAWGKPVPSGILKGNTLWTGSYDECVHPLFQPANKSYLKQPIATQYCLLSPKPASAGTQQPAISISIGLCVPSSCDRNVLAYLINDIFNSSHINETQLTCSSQPANGQESFTTGAIITLSIIGSLIALVLIGTLIDIIISSGYKHSEKNHQNNNDHELPINRNKSYQKSHLISDENSTSNPILKFFIDFSALKSLKHIFTLDNSVKRDNFHFINGIRVLALFTVIIGHSLVFGLSYSSNALDVLSWTRNFFFQLILNAVLSVDTFFVLSGFLTAYLFNREIERRTKLSFGLMVKYYLHRYIRLTPTFIIMVLFSIHLTPYLGQGPVYPTQQGLEVPACRSTYWWTSLVYVGNLVHSEAMCLPITWYLHNDMQFHWIAPLTLIPFVLGWQKLGTIIGILLALSGSGAILGILLYYPDMSLNSLTEFGATNGPSFFDLIYIKPWCRIAPYAVGILTAYVVIYVTRQHKTNRWLKLFLHMMKYSLALLCLFGTYPDYILPSGMDRWILIFYQTVSRTVWALFIGWLLFLGCTNQGGIVTKILSWPIWGPFARLNYSCYLVHSTVISVAYFSQSYPLYYQGHLVVNNFVVHIFFSYFAAIFVNIFIETPFFILEKYFLKSK